MLNTIFRNLFNVEEPPNKVLEVKSDKIKSYDSRPVIYREESILLYGPKNTSDRRNNVEKSYEIVFHKYFTENLIHTYSLFRSEEREPAEDRFIVFKDKVPVYINVIKDCSVASLQKVCDTLSEYRSWTIAHLAAHYGQSELFNVPAIQAHMDEADPLTGATPLMVAVKSCNTRMVQCLLSLNCSLDSVDVDGNTIYHYAAASNRDIINALSSKSQTTLNVYNGQGYTPLHMACLANAPDCVRALLLSGADVNLSAVSRSHPSSMGALKGIVGDVLQDNQPKLYQEDMKHGGTPLHWACSREVIEVLVDKNCDINALNFDGRTALHVMVMRGRLDCVVALLSLDAVHSIGDKEGNTPLHLAVKQNNISILQALIVFGADLEAKNDLGQTARHVVPIEMSNSVYDKMLFMLHSVGAKRCSELGVAGCRSGCAARGEYAGVAPAAAPRACTRDAVNYMLSVAAMERAAERAPAKQRTQGRLLCLDGGGIRGLVLIQILLNLEEAVGKPIIHCFDWVAGTSTGGILALALASNMTLRACQRLYFKMKDHAFVGRRPYPPEPLENILKECLGTETVMTDIKHPKLMILAVMADRKPVDLHMFRNYQSPHDMLDEHNGISKVGGHGDSPDGSSPACSVVTLPAPAPPSQQLVWQAARSSGAAPSYFRASGRYLDGGLMGNNPTLDAMTELTELGLALRATGREEEAQKTNLKIVVSCGTGLIPVSRVSDLDVFKPEGLWEAVKLAYSLPAMANLLVDQATQADGRVVERARAWCAGAGAPYYRFSPQLSQDVSMDERSDAVLVNMLWETHRYMREHRDRITELAAMLVD